MRRHVLGLLLATVLCWHLCQGEIEFYSDDVMCSKNGTTKTVSIQKAVSVIFCVTLGPQDVLHKDVRIRSSNQSSLEGTLYRLNITGIKPQVSSLTKASYTTINITFTKVESEDFNEKFFVSIFQKSGAKLEEKVLVWFILEQETGEIKFYSDDGMCSKNGTTKTASIQKAVSVIFCVTLGPQDVIHNDVRIRSSSQSYLEGTLYRLNNTGNRPQVTSLTKASYTTINITFTKLQTGDFNETFFVSIFQINGTKLEEKVLVWFILEQEAEATDSVNRLLDTAITAVIVFILCTTTGSLIYCCRKRSLQRSRQAVSVNKQEELPRQNDVPLLPTVANIPGQSTGSGHGNKSRDRFTCPVELSSPYTQYEEIRNVETGLRESSSVPASRAFSDIQPEQVEYEIAVQEKPRDGTPYCYVELMDDPSGVSATSVSSAADKEISQFSNIVEYENTLPVL